MRVPLKALLNEATLFEGVPYEDLQPFLKDAELVEVEKGELIGREGEYNDNCSILLRGLVQVDITGANQEKKTAYIGSGEIFGEIAALSGNPRTADLTAAKPGAVLNIPRTSLYKILDNFPVVKERIDTLYRRRALVAHLNAIPVFAGLSPSVMKELQKKVSLRSFKKGEVIFREGEEADSFYLVRYGYVKVYTEEDGREKVLAYLKEGHYFGEMALLNQGQKRMATVVATTRTEVISISTDDFQSILEKNPNLKGNLELVVRKREERNRQLARDTHLESVLSHSLNEGIMQSKAILVMDTTRCVRCDNCVRACAALHDGQSRLVRKGTKFNDFILVPTSCRHCEDPTCMSKCPTGAISRDASGEIYHKDFCIGCGNCARNCPYGNISLVTVNGNGGRNAKRLFAGLLGGNGKKNTPSYGSALPGDRDMVEKSDDQKLPGDRDMVEHSAKKASGNGKDRPGRKAVKCDMCREYEFMGCVYHCPRGAARRVDPSEFFADLKTIG